jgi:ubiquinone/menaquinone biosynthesis C-methylase UbiE
MFLQPTRSRPAAENLSAVAKAVGLEPRSRVHPTALQDRIQFVARSTRDLDRGDGFDLITACDCVHDFSAPHRTLGEIARVAEAGGDALRCGNQRGRSIQLRRCITASACSIT